MLIHLGLYAYTAEFLQTFSTLAPGNLETAEKLEMLRATEHGYRIAVGVSNDPYIEIDTPEQARDLEVATLRRDDSEGDGAVESVGISDREHDLSDSQLIRSAHRHDRQVTGAMSRWAGLF